MGDGVDEVAPVGEVDVVELHAVFPSGRPRAGRGGPRPEAEIRTRTTHHRGPAPARTRGATREPVTVLPRVGLDPPGPAREHREPSAMFLEETPEQQRLRDELRAYYADLLTDEVRAGLAEGGEGGEQWRQSRPDHRQGRLAGHRLAHRVRRAGPAGHRPVHLLRRDAPGRRPVPLRHREHGRPDHHAVRHRGAEAVLPAPRSCPARSTSPSATPSPRPAPIWPRCAPGPCATATSYVVERGQDLHQRRRQADYVWLAVRTDPDAPKHKGISILCVPTTAPGFAWNIIHTVGGPHHHRHLLRRRAGPGHHAGGGGERGLADDHHPAQPRAGGAGRLERALPAAVRRGGGVGGRRRPATTAGA